MHPTWELYRTWHTNKKRLDNLCLVIQSCVATSYPHRGKPPTTIGAKKLNFCVRHGNRCILLAIDTTLFTWVIDSLKTGIEKFYFSESFWLSPRSISISPLHTSLYFHSWPIYLIISQGSYFLKEMGNLILRWASHLDAFSVYPFPT